MTDSSLVPKAASFAGVEFNQLVIKIVQSSLDKKDIKM
jgi:D-alanine-D-alanine ligase-like ATP-grasp enzyme